MASKDRRVWQAMAQSGQKVFREGRMCGTRWKGWADGGHSGVKYRQSGQKIEWITLEYWLPQTTIDTVCMEFVYSFVFCIIVLKKKKYQSTV